MNTDDIVEYRFLTVNPRLQRLFPFDPKYDIEIIFKNNKYELQSAYLRLESKFFNKINPYQCKALRIDEPFNEDHFQQIMKCFYGGTFKCSRTKIFDAWKIFQYLKIENFKKHTIKEIKKNFQKYNLFELMTFGFINNVEEIFSNCLALLDANDFSQLRQNKEELLLCPLELFRFLINTHNRRPKDRRTLNYIEVNTLISEYSERNQYSDAFFQELKFQLIEKTQLSSEQYKLIFIQGTKSQSIRVISDVNLTQKGSFNYESQPLIQCLPIKSMTSFSGFQKEHWLQKLHNLKSNFEKGKNDSILLQISMQKLTKSINRKAENLRLNEGFLSRIQAFVKEIEAEMEQKNESLIKISKRIEKLQFSTEKGNCCKDLKFEKEEDDIFVESHIIPGYCLGDILDDMQNNKKQMNNKYTSNLAKKNKTSEESKKQQLTKQYHIKYEYQNSLIFDQEPISVPRKYLNNLMKLMETDSFRKKKQLTLIFRRSKTERNKVGDSEDLKNRAALLLLFETSFKKYAGGFISVEIPSFTKIDSLCDYQAFIFSLTHNVKMPIMKGEQDSAISLSKHYLLSFGNDLMISNDCLNESSYCEWPGIYQVPEHSKCISAKDLIGTDDEFQIEKIDIYEVKNEEIR